MDKGIIKMVIKVIIIAIILLSGSLYLAMRYGGLMLQSAVNTSDQDNGTGVSDSSSSANQKSTTPQK